MPLQSPYIYIYIYTLYSTVLYYTLLDYTSKHPIRIMTVPSYYVADSLPVFSGTDRFGRLLRLAIRSGIVAVRDFRLQGCGFRV